MYEIKEYPFPWCGGKLTMFMDMDTAHPSLAYLGLAEDRLWVQTCMDCGYYGIIFMEVGFTWRAGLEPVQREAGLLYGYVCGSVRLDSTIQFK
ncbi:MAG: hypothetical protein ACQEXX_17240 [Bacillota bacterium]